MEMEHINENTIRVTIENEDLAARGITFLDLLGNQKEIENFFYSILEEVDVADEFEGSDAVTFQVMPKGDSLELLISKNLFNEEVQQMDFTQLEGDEIGEFLKKQIQEDFADEPSNTAVYALRDMEDMILLAKEVFLERVVTNLYQYKGHLYLTVASLEEELSEDEQAVLLEFAEQTNVTPEVLEEYGKLLMEQTALETTRYYFQ